MTEREVIEEFATLLRGFAQAQKEFLDRVVDEHYRAQEALVERVIRKTRTPPESEKAGSRESPRGLGVM
jgi:hypothetical protein